MTTFTNVWPQHWSMAHGWAMRFNQRTVVFGTALFLLGIMVGVLLMLAVTFLLVR